MTGRTITRRHVLKRAAGSSFVVLALASGGKIVAQERSPVASWDFSEAPMLLGQVTSRFFGSHGSNSG